MTSEQQCSGRRTPSGTQTPKHEMWATVGPSLFIFEIPTKVKIISLKLSVLPATHLDQRSLNYHNFLTFSTIRKMPRVSESCDVVFYWQYCFNTLIPPKACEQLLCLLGRQREWRRYAERRVGKKKSYENIEKKNKTYQQDVPLK